MAWLRIDDRVRTHPKIAQAGPSAAWLWFCGICYCREHLTDGFIPKAVVPTLAMNLSSPWKHAVRLVEVRLWEDAVGGYQVHDFLEWNPSKEDVEANREWGTQRKSLYRDKDTTAAVRKRDQDTCRYCGRRVNFHDRRGPGGGQLDHVIPRGPNTLDNIVVACRECNARKNNRRPEDCGMVLQPSPNQLVGTSSDSVLPRERARDRAGDAGSGSLSGSEDLALSVEEEPISTAPPAWRSRSARTESLQGGEAYHRRNCAPWAYRACEAGLCVPKYLWPQWEKRKPAEALRVLVETWAPRAQGDKAEKFWPAAFEAHFGTSAPQTAKGDRTTRTLTALDIALSGGEVTTYRKAVGDGS